MERLAPWLAAIGLGGAAVGAYVDVARKAEAAAVELVELKAMAVKVRDYGIESREVAERDRRRLAERIAALEGPCRPADELDPAP